MQMPLLTEGARIWVGCPTRKTKENESWGTNQSLSWTCFRLRKDLWYDSTECVVADWFPEGDRPSSSVWRDLANACFLEKLTRWGSSFECKMEEWRHRNWSGSHRGTPGSRAREPTERGGCPCIAIEWDRLVQHSVSKALRSGIAQPASVGIMAIPSVLSTTAVSA